MEHFVFYSSLAYNVVLNRLKYRNWFDRIDNNVILGALPFKGKFSNELIQEENVAAVISMNQDYELKPFSPSNDEWKRLGVEFLQLPTKDFYEVPSLDNLRKGVSLIEKYATLSKDTYPQLSVYIHCKAGRTRSATLVACYLIKKNKISVDEAVELIRSKRRHIYLSEQHLYTIQMYQNSLTQS